MENGAFGLVDSSAPFIVSGLTAFEQVVLRLPRDQFAIRVAEQIADDAMGQSIAADAGIGRLTSTFLVDLANHGDDLTTTSLAAVSSAVLDVVAAAVNQGVESHTLTELAHAEDLREVQRVMMRYIADPERTIADAAADLGMSVRYVHKLFSTAGTTPRAWLYSAASRRRERCCYRRISASPRSDSVSDFATPPTSAGRSASTPAPVPDDSGGQLARRARAWGEDAFIVALPTVPPEIRLRAS